MLTDVVLATIADEVSLISRIQPYQLQNPGAMKAPPHWPDQRYIMAAP